MTPFLLAKQNYDQEIMQLMNQYKPIAAAPESSFGGCTFLGFCEPTPSNSNLRSLKNADIDLFEL